MTYDPNTPTVIQSGDWQCSAASSAWVLRSLGISWGQDDVVSWLGPRNITEETGLQEASGRMLAALFKERGLEASFGQITWERALEMAGRQPFCMGGGRWNHWTAVRGTDGRRLLLANPAPNWQGVGQELDRDEWAALGGWNAAWVNVSQSLDDLEAASPGMVRTILDWQRARYRNEEDPNDYAACRDHLLAIGVRDPGSVEPIGFRRPTIDEVEAANPSIRLQIAEWQQARRQNGEDVNDYPACRAHLRALGSPDPGPAEFLGFFSS
jgi:hypothetical protein